MNPAAHLCDSPTRQPTMRRASEGNDCCFYQPPHPHPAQGQLLPSISSGGLSTRGQGDIFGWINFPATSPTSVYWSSCWQEGEPGSQWTVYVQTESWAESLEPG